MRLLLKNLDSKLSSAFTSGCLFRHDIAYFRAEMLVSSPEQVKNDWLKHYLTIMQFYLE